MSCVDLEDDERDTMYPPGHKSAPKFYMRMHINYTNPRSFENYVRNKKYKKKKK